MQLGRCRHPFPFTHLNESLVAYVAVWLLMTLLGLSAVGALVWAIGNGQMADLRRGAESIFDEEEPIGVVTDHFPGRGASRVDNHDEIVEGGDAGDR